jgi:hypothetical protein
MSTFRDTLKLKNVPKQSGPFVDQNNYLFYYTSNISKNTLDNLP